MISRKKRRIEAAGNSERTLLEAVEFFKEKLNSYSNTAFLKDEIAQLVGGNAEDTDHYSSTQVPAKDVNSWLAQFRQSDFANNFICEERHDPSRVAKYGTTYINCAQLFCIDDDFQLDEAIKLALHHAWNVDKLYKHQSEAIGALRNSRNVLVATNTAS